VDSNGFETQTQTNPNPTRVDPKLDLKPKPKPKFKPKPDLKPKQDLKPNSMKLNTIPLDLNPKVLQSTLEELIPKNQETILNETKNVSSSSIGQSNNREIIKTRNSNLAFINKNSFNGDLIIPPKDLNLDNGDSEPSEILPLSKKRKHEEIYSTYQKHSNLYVKVDKLRGSVGIHTNHSSKFKNDSTISQFKQELNQKTITQSEYKSRVARYILTKDMNNHNSNSKITSFFKPIERLRRSIDGSSEDDDSPFPQAKKSKTDKFESSSIEMLLPKTLERNDLVTIDSEKSVESLVEIPFLLFQNSIEKNH
jgi:hypothetical protein